ncbi:MAG: BsuPI-related putative proteinase inhibitor [Armatimonadetes bacterium]|nr:BsuPI-related putative proteinase inhibitor [Armatimonadota bacterium]
MKDALVGIVLIMLFALPGYAQQAGGDMIQGVKAEQPSYSLGEPVTLIFAVRNRGTAPVTYTFPSSKLYDIWVKLGDTEVYRWSKGRMFLTVITTLKLDPGETREFRAEWNQKDMSGKDVGPGVYEVHAQLQPSRNKPPETKGKVKVGVTTVAVVPVNIAEAVRRADELSGRRVQISASYRGFQPNAGDPNTKDGPPVTRSDWAICDSTGCMYVNGPIDLDPANDTGKRVNVVGKVRKTPKGQVYLVLESVTVERPA